MRGFRALRLLVCLGTTLMCLGSNLGAIRYENCGSRRFQGKILSQAATGNKSLVAAHVVIMQTERHMPRQRVYALQRHADRFIVFGGF